MRSVVAEAARHAAAGRLDDLDGKAGHQRQDTPRGVDGVERFLMAMTVQQRAFLRRHCEAVYISRGFPPSEDDLPPSAG